MEDDQYGRDEEDQDDHSNAQRGEDLVDHRINSRLSFDRDRNHEVTLLPPGLFRSFFIPTPSPMALRQGLVTPVTFGWSFERPTLALTGFFG